jgi:hypothetical protein
MAALSSWSGLFSQIEIFFQRSLTYDSENVPS